MKKKTTRKRLKKVSKLYQREKMKVEQAEYTMSVGGVPPDDLTGARLLLAVNSDIPNESMNALAQAFQRYADAVGIKVSDTTLIEEAYVTARATEEEAIAASPGEVRTAHAHLLDLLSRIESGEVVANHEETARAILGFVNSNAPDFITNAVLIAIEGAAIAHNLPQPYMTPEETTETATPKVAAILAAAGEMFSLEAALEATGRTLEVERRASR